MAAASRPVTSHSLNAELCLIDRLLHNDIIILIFEQIAKNGDYRTLCRLSQTSRRFYVLIQGDHLWNMVAQRVTPIIQRQIADPRARVIRFIKGEVPYKAFIGHEGDVNSVAIFLDGSRALSGSDDHTLKVWDLASGKCVSTLEDHRGIITSVATFPDGRCVLSGSDDCTLKVWDLATGTCLRTLVGHEGWVRSIAIFPNGGQALSGSSDCTLKVWDLATGKCLRTLAGHKHWVRSVAISPDGGRALSGSSDRTLKVWDLVTGKCLRTLSSYCESDNMLIHRYPVYGVAFSPDGRLALSGSVDCRIKLWDLATGECLMTLAGHPNIVTSMAFSPDGGHAFSGGGDETIKVWDLDTGECVSTLAGHEGCVRSVAISPDGRQVLSGSDDCTLKVWEF